MAQTLQEHGFKIVSGGTDNHLFLVDLIDKNIAGKDAENALGEAYITLNKNMVPNDPRSPFVTSGLRIGTPALTTRGFKEQEVKKVAEWISEILADLNNKTKIEQIKRQVTAICQKFPVYQV